MNPLKNETNVHTSHKLIHYQLPYIAPLHKHTPDLKPINFLQFKYLELISAIFPIYFPPAAPSFHEYGPVT